MPDGSIEPGRAGSPQTYRFMRYRDGFGSKAKVPLKGWWNDPCWDSGSNKISNKDLVLAMSNKEGGVHVDGDMPAKYRVAKAQGSIGIGAMPVSNIAKLGSLIAFAAGELLEYLDQNFGDCFPVIAAALAGG